MYIDNKDPKVKLACDYIKNGEVSKLTELLDKGLHCDTVIIQGTKECGTLLHYACHVGSIDIVNLLIERGANINSTRNWLESSPIIASFSRFNKNSKIARRLLACGADPTLLLKLDNANVLHIAIAGDKIASLATVKKIVEASKKRNFDILNHKDHNGMKPLHYLLGTSHWGVDKKKIEIIKYIVSNGFKDSRILDNQHGYVSFHNFGVRTESTIGMTCKDFLKDKIIYKTEMERTELMAMIEDE